MLHALSGCTAIVCPLAYYLMLLLQLLLCHSRQRTRAGSRTRHDKRAVPGKKGEAQEARRDCANTRRFWRHSWLARGAAAQHGSIAEQCGGAYATSTKEPCRRGETHASSLQNTCPDLPVTLPAKKCSYVHPSITTDRPDRMGAA